MEPTTPATPGQNAERSVDQASATAHDKIERASDALHPAVDRLASGAHQAVDKLAGVATQASHTLGAKSEQMKDVQQKLAEDCRAYVREKPVTALAIAAGAGFLISRLLHSSR